MYRKGHYGRALEEAIQTQRPQWPRQWISNPLSGGRGFNTMTAVDRVGAHQPRWPIATNMNRRSHSCTPSLYGALTKMS